MNRLLVEDNCGPDWHSQDAREFKKLKPSVPEIPKKDKDAERMEAKSGCSALYSLPDFFKMGAAGVKIPSWCYADWKKEIEKMTKEIEKMEHNKKAMLSNPDFFKEDEYSVAPPVRSPPSPQPDPILEYMRSIHSKDEAERIAADLSPVGVWMKNARTF